MFWYGDYRGDINFSERVEVLVTSVSSNNGDRSMNSNRVLVWLLASALVFPATTVFAFDDDEMTFEPEEVEDEMTFAPDDLEDDDFDPEDEIDESVDVGVVAVPGDDITAEERDRLQDALRDAADDIPEISIYGDADLLSALEERGPDYCSRESICLASVGDGVAVDRILQARVEDDGGSFRLDIDYFDVDDRLFVAYHSNSGLSSIDDVIEAIPPGVDDIFGIRRDVDGDMYVDDRDVNIQSVLAYSTAGAAVASLGTGILFGMQVNSQQSDLEAARDGDGNYSDLTQTEARSQQRSMENAALTANVFYGLSAGLAATSLALFVLGGGDDATASSGQTPWYGAVEWSPQFGGEQVGLGATFNF